ncbi:MAG: TlpA disulfide reductase family protein [Gammaproteobacteria bacterium]
MRTHHLATGLAFLMLMAFPPCFAGKAPPIGAPVPDNLGETLDKQPVVASAYLGKVVVISFWASWCAPCRKELPVLEQLQRTAAKDGLQVIAVNLEDARTFRKLMAKLSESQMTYSRNVRGKTSKLFGVDPIPHMVIVGRDGKIARRYVGYDEKKLPEIVDVLNALLIG